MKANELLNKAKEELTTITEEKVIDMIKESLKEIADCKKTLRRLEKKHNKLLDTEIEDIEIDDFEY